MVFGLGAHGHHGSRASVRCSSRIGPGARLATLRASPSAAAFGYHPPRMTDLLAGVLDALVANVDADVLRVELARRLGEPPRTTLPTLPGAESGEVPSAQPSPRAAAVLRRMVLEDILDEPILSARPTDREFPLRIFFGQLGESLDDDGGFALASALSFYFRVPMDEDTKVRVGVEASKLYYLFCEQTDVGQETVRQASPLLAALMTTQLEKVRLEAVDHMPSFDSSVHERVSGSMNTSPEIKSARSFLARVKANNMVRSRALVRT